jgi:excisionase family DNA binding protein
VACASLAYLVILPHHGLTEKILDSAGGPVTSTDTMRLPKVKRLGFSPDEVAESLGISRELLNDLLRRGELQSVKAGSRRIITKFHLAQYLGIPEQHITDLAS